MIKRALFVFLWGTFICFNFNLYMKNTELSRQNKELFQFFDDNHLVDVSGNINLSEIKSIEKENKEKIKNLYSIDKISVEQLDLIMNNKKESNKKLNDDIISANEECRLLDDEINTLTNQYQVIKKKYDSYIYSIRSVSVGDGSSVLLSNVPTINQYPSYYTGCEPVALTILLRSNNVSVSPNQIIDNLNKSGLPYFENGVRYGGNPEVEFVGNPYGGGYGVYHNPIANVANMFKGGIHVETNFPLSNVLNLVKNGHPVQVWTSMSLALPYVSESWVYKPTGENVLWHANEHSVVVVGYNDSNIIISDPIGGAIKYQSRSVFEERYNYFGRRALYYL